MRPSLGAGLRTGYVEVVFVRDGTVTGTVRAVAGTIGIVSFAQSSRNGDGAPGERTSCTSACEQQLWPRIVIGVLGDPTGMIIDVDLDQTGHFRALKELCPVGFDHTRYDCSFALWTGRTDTNATLHYVHADAERRSSVSIQLGPYNYCGRDIAYVELTPGADTVAWAPVRYLTPCAMLR